MKYQELELNSNYLTDSYTITVNNHEIQVLKYLPISDKNDLIGISLQKAQQDGLYNLTLLDAYFHLNIIYLYTNIEFDEEDKVDELALYDVLESNGVIDEVVKAIGEEEYNDLYEGLMEQMDDKLTQENTAAAVLRRIISDLPKNAAAAKEIVENFDPEKYQAVADFAIAANGGRNINTNITTDQQTVPVKPPAMPQDHKKKEIPPKILAVKSATKKD